MRNRFPRFFRVLLLIVAVMLSEPVYPAESARWVKGVLCGALLTGAVVIPPVLEKHNYNLPEMVKTFF